jgi:ERCC4-type nuclease
MPEPPPFTILIDTREKAPFPFAGLTTKRATLKSGDYSIEVDGESWSNRVAVERKSYSDIWGSMSMGRARFKRCVERLAELDRAAIVIECGLYHLCEQPSRIKRTTPASVVGGLISWSVQYSIPVFFCDTRYLAERVTARYLASYFKHRGAK